LNVLKPNVRISIQTLLHAGTAQREIARVTGVDRKTIRRYAREANSPGVATGFSGEKVAGADQNPPPRPPARTPPAAASACEIHRRFRYFIQESRTVDDSGLVQVARSYYAAIPAAPGDEVTVRELSKKRIDIRQAATRW
jgi:transcriptional regulator with XRE-family HTH domain